MTDDRQRERFKEAVDRKNEQARRRSERNPTPEPGDLPTEPVGDVEGDQESLYEQGRPQETVSARKKSSGHGKKTADKWNQ